MQSVGLKLNTFLIAFIILISNLAFGQANNPTILDLESSDGAYVPVYRAYEASSDNLDKILSQVRSPFSTRSVKIVEQSTLTEVPYDESFAKAVIFNGTIPVTTINISQYRNFEFRWLNEELLHLTNSPGRCIKIDTIFDVSRSVLIYKAGFNHCGV